VSAEGGCSARHGLLDRFGQREVVVAEAGSVAARLLMDGMFAMREDGISWDRDVRPPSFRTEFQKKGEKGRAGGPVRGVGSISTGSASSFGCRSALFRRKEENVFSAEGKLGAGNRPGVNREGARFRGGCRRVGVELSSVRWAGPFAVGIHLAEFRRRSGGSTAQKGKGDKMSSVWGGSNASWSETARKCEKQRGDKTRLSRPSAFAVRCQPAGGNSGGGEKPTKRQDWQ